MNVEADFTHNPWVVEGGVRRATSVQTRARPFNWDRVASAAAEAHRLMRKGVCYDPGGRRETAMKLLTHMGLVRRSASGYWLRRHSEWRSPVVVCMPATDLFDAWDGPVQAPGGATTLDFLRAELVRKIGETPRLHWKLLTDHPDRARAFLGLFPASDNVEVLPRRRTQVELHADGASGDAGDPPVSYKFRR